MSKVITFSQVFPTYHPMKGQPTYFVEKFNNWAFNNLEEPEAGFQNYLDALEFFNPSIDLSLLEQFANSLVGAVTETKNHTIRAGNRWREGEYFSPRVWSGKPYNSKQIVIAPDVEIKKEWSFEIHDGVFSIGNKLYDGEIESHHELLEMIALNDGLSKYDFVNWFDFKKDFSGQIICWNDEISYEREVLGTDRRALA